MYTLFCENLKNARKASGFTQREIAIQLSVEESCYVNCEQGRTEPNVDTIRKLCKILEVTADELING